MAVVCRISRPGKRVTDAADFEQALNDQFQGLPIVSQGLYTSPAGTGDKTVTTHGLGYFPAHIIFIKVGSRWEYFFGGWVNSSDQLRINGNAGAQFYYFIFAVDIETNITQITQNTTAGDSVGTPTVGVRVRHAGGADGVNKNLDFDSKNPPLIIHSLTNRTYSSSPPLSDNVSHNLTRVPFFLVYLRLTSTRYGLVSNTVNSTVSASSSAVFYTFLNPPATTKVATLIFKNTID